jgi:hypothetical protein
LRAYIIENIHFHELIVDPYRNLIYRIHVKDMVNNNIDHDNNYYYKKPMIITVFDMDFHVLNEIQLEGNTYSNVTSWFVNSDGLFLNAYNPYSGQTDFEKLIYHCFQFKR